jgi:hypothetical protein
MILIAHRGCTEGSNASIENKPDHLLSLLVQGYHVEIDTWFKNNEFDFGHDGPLYKVNISDFIRFSGQCWFHCKNVNALSEFRKYNANYFWHQNDDYVITSWEYIWANVGQRMKGESVAVLPEVKEPENLKDAYAICTDNFSLWNSLKPEIKSFMPGSLNVSTR